MRFTRLAIFCILNLLVSFDVWAGLSCNLYKILNSAELADKEAFWQEYGSLGPKANERQVMSLMKKHGISVETAADAGGAFAAPVSTQSGFAFAKTALKDVEKITPIQRRKLDEFLTYAKDGAMGLQPLYERPGEWNLKKLKGLFQGQTAYSARLDKSYRVVFTKTEDGGIEILNVDKDTTH